MINYYERLGLSIEASDDEIKTALVENLCDVPYDELKLIADTLNDKDKKEKYDKELLAYLEKSNDKDARESVDKKDVGFFFKFMDKFKKDEYDGDIEHILNKEEQKERISALLKDVDVHENDKIVILYAVLYALFVILSVTSVLILDKASSHSFFGIIFFIIDIAYFISLFYLIKKEKDFLVKIKISPFYLISCVLFIPLIYFLKRNTITSTLNFTIYLSAIALAFEFLFFL